MNSNIEEFLNTNLTSGICEFAVLNQSSKKTDETFFDRFGKEIEEKMSGENKNVKNAYYSLLDLNTNKFVVDKFDLKDLQEILDQFRRPFKFCVHVSHFVYNEFYPNYTLDPYFIIDSEFGPYLKRDK